MGRGPVIPDRGLDQSGQTGTARSGLGPAIQRRASSNGMTEAHPKMYRGEDAGSTVLTQDQSIYEQLRGGVRYFDIRVLAGNPQHIYHGYSWFKGPPLHEVLNDVQRFIRGSPGSRYIKIFAFPEFRRLFPRPAKPGRRDISIVVVAYSACEPAWCHCLCHNEQIDPLGFD
jgi:hypothetical protein